MPLLALWLAGAVLGSPPTSAPRQDAGAAAALAETDQAERVQAALAAHAAAQRTFDAFLETGPERAAERAAYEDVVASRAACATELLAAAHLDPASEPAREACRWILIEAASRPEGNGAFDVLAGALPEPSLLLELLPAARTTVHPGSERFLRAALATELPTEARANVLSALGDHLLLPPELLGALGPNRRHIVAEFGLEFVERLEALDAAGVAELLARGYEPYRRIVADTELSSVRRGSETFGDFARRLLFEADHLSVGCTAPEIEGTDSADVAFKLSDYRGQVVLLDFWGHW